MPLVVDRDLLIRWHLQDLPDNVERARNDAVEALQGTRNPFIDDPAMAGLPNPDARTLPMQDIVTRQPAAHDRGHRP